MLYPTTHVHSADAAVNMTVLDNDIKKRHVVWNTSQNRVDVNNSKLRRRHLELVIARVMRAQGAAAA